MPSRGLSVDSPEVNDAFAPAWARSFPFLSDQERKVVKMLDMTETSKSQGVTAMPYTFALMPDLTIHNLYSGYWFVGRPTLDELRVDLRAMLKEGSPGFCRSDRLKSSFGLRCINVDTVSAVSDGIAPTSFLHRVASGP